MTPAAGGTRRRLGLAVADQAFSSLTNFGLALVVARTVDVREFGVFTIVFATYTIVLGITRALATEPLAVRYGGAAEPEMRAATASAAGTGLAVAAAASLVCAAASLGAGGSLADGLLALAVILPGLVLQDCWRLSFFAAERGGAAFANDLLWAGVLAAGLAALVGGRDDVSIVGPLLVWGGGAAVASVAGAAQARAFPAVAHTRAWLRETGHLSSRYAGEFLTTIAGAQLTLFGVGLVAGLAGAAAVRGGQVVLGPLNVLFMGAALVAVPEALRALRRSRDDLTRFATVLAAALACAALVWGAVVVALPDDAGAAVLGPTWDVAEPVIVPLTVWLAALGAAAGPMTALRALGAARRSLRARTVVTIASTVAGIAGAVVAGAEGAAWGLAGAAVAGAVVWWRALAGAEPEAPEPDPLRPAPVP